MESSLLTLVQAMELANQLLHDISRLPTTSPYRDAMVMSDLAQFYAQLNSQLPDNAARRSVWNHIRLALVGTNESHDVVSYAISLPLSIQNFPRRRASLLRLSG